MKKTVSIIVPIYNVEQYLPKCLDSLLRQTYSDIKIYAVVDGSPDNSISIVKKYAKKDSRIICVDKENGGYGSVLEETIRKIDTEYFMICDPDDWLADNAVEELITCATKNKLDIVIGDKYNVYTYKDDVPYVKSNEEHPEIKPGVIYKNPAMLCLLSVSPHSKLYRTELAKNIVFPRKVSYTDFLLYMVVLSNAKKGMYIDKALSYYLLDRPGNTTTDKSLKAFMNQIVVFNATLDQINSKDVYLLARLYDQYRHYFIELISFLDKAGLKSVKKELKCLYRLKEYKKELYKYVSENSKGKFEKIIFKLLFNKCTNYMTVVCLSKRYKKRRNK